MTDGDLLECGIRYDGSNIYDCDRLTRLMTADQLGAFLDVRHPNMAFMGPRIWKALDDSGGDAFVRIGSGFDFGDSAIEAYAEVAGAKISEVSGTPRVFAVASATRSVGGVSKNSVGFYPFRKCSLVAVPIMAMSPDRNPPDFMIFAIECETGDCLGIIHSFFVECAEGIGSLETAFGEFVKEFPRWLTGT